MQTSEVIASHIRNVFSGGNWTDSDVKDQLADVTWQEATKQIFGLNTIAVLTYHIGYFVGVQLRVLQGGPLEGSDKLSFDHPPILNQKDWENMRDEILNSAQALSDAVEQLPDAQLHEDFVDPKYGTYYANLVGMIEHTHYHLGQISLIKKMLRNNLRD